jgi:predicted amino acid-binding ACT domain protein
MGKNPAQGWACYAEGSDQVGVYADLLQKIAKAGINLHATDAFAVGGKFATVFFAEQKDVPALCKALGC